MLLDSLCILTWYFTWSSRLYCSMHLYLLLHLQFFSSKLWTSLKFKQESEHRLSVLLFRHFCLFGRVLLLHDSNFLPQPNPYVGFQCLFGSLNAEDFELSCLNALQNRKQKVSRFSKDTYILGLFGSLCFTFLFRNSSQEFLELIELCFSFCLQLAITDVLLF